ncbi:SgcJ/EcaC family oxidoreductase [Streptomyces sp. NPDC056352]|uniref:SgcJ/EcaC family oxidoreductase n=1 Tax=Streptomyces sp. NPDC056352 TaxID=3345791 RepID=UPI0035DD55A4
MVLPGRHLLHLNAAWADNDADAFAALYTQDATSVLPGSCSDGKEAFRARMAAGFAGPLEGSTVVDEVRSVRFIGEGAAVVTSRSGILSAGKSTAPADRFVLATWVLGKAAGQGGGGGLAGRRIPQLPSRQRLIARPPAAHRSGEIPLGAGRGFGLAIQGRTPAPRADAHGMSGAPTLGQCRSTIKERGERRVRGEPAEAERSGRGGRGWWRCGWWWWRG